MKGALRRLFLCALLALIYAPVNATTACEPDHIDETDVDVAWVHDGDTIKLKDGRRVRFLGIDTPEIGRNAKPDQPYAARARDQLRRLIEQANMRVSLSYGVERKDHYGRLLAHVTARIDGSPVNLNARMLSTGLAIAYATPPNTRLWACYSALESAAAENETGIWSHAKYQPVQASQLLRSRTGFHIIDATIDDVRTTKKAIWLRALPLKVYIAKRDFGHFEDGWLNALKGKRLRLRGWVHKDRYEPATRRFMKLRHPSAIEIVEQVDEGRVNGN